MFLTHDFEQQILYDPAIIDGDNCDHLEIVTGFTDCDMINTHILQLQGEQGRKGKYNRHIYVDVILGMYKGSGLNANKHTNIIKTLNQLNSIKPNNLHINLRYVYRNANVHSKTYVWLRGNEPVKAFVGSANYSIYAFQNRREVMTDCPAKDVSEYYDSLLEDTIDCFDKDLLSKIKFSNKVISAEELELGKLENITYEELKKRTPIDVIEVSWLESSGKVGEVSGPNWGFRSQKYNRNRDEAYIPYNSKDRKDGFFPGRMHESDKNCKLFKAFTPDMGMMYMRVAQQNNKGIQTAESNALLGKWMRRRMGVPDKAFVTLDDFKRYKRSKVKFSKYADDLFIMEF